jgi:antirestriction protein
MSADFRIYVASSADYNAGRLHGSWIDLDGKDLETVQREVAAMLRASRYPNVTRAQCLNCNHIQDHRDQDDTCNECGEALGEPFASAEEYAIHDYDGFEPIRLEEYTPLADVVEIVAGLDSLDDHDAVGFRYLLWADSSTKPAEALEKASEVMWRSGPAHEAVAELMEETHDMDEIPEAFRNHIDWESMANDWRACGDLVSFDDPEQGRVTILNANSL